MLDEDRCTRVVLNSWKFSVCWEQKPHALNVMVLFQFRAEDFSIIHYLQPSRDLSIPDREHNLYALLQAGFMRSESI